MLKTSEKTGINISLFSTCNPNEIRDPLIRIFNKLIPIAASQNQISKK